jgi:RNA polymerase sigma factor (sigma-70 family)
MRTVVDNLRRMAMLADHAGPGDGELLEWFLARHDALAFETLLRRHGPMVLGVCRRILRNVHDAEDAFQATFLVLARKANDIRPREMVGHWLYGVAYRTARKALAMNAKRRTKERKAIPVCQSNGTDDGPPEELLARLDAEVQRLPEKYRVPVVLCELEGKSRKEVARMLGLAEGTLSWRLAHARKLLAQRLAPYGSMLSAGALALILSRDSACASVSPALLAATLRAGLQTMTAGTVSAQVIALTEGVVHAMFYSKLKLIGALVLAIAVTAGVGISYRASAADPQRQANVAPAARTTADEIEELRLEVAALRKGLEITRARVKALENERQTARAQSQERHEVIYLDPNTKWAEVKDLLVRPGIKTEVKPLGHVLLDRNAHIDLDRVVPDTKMRVQVDVNNRVLGVQLAADPIAEAETALKKLRKNPHDKQAMQSLSDALKTLNTRAGDPPAKKDAKRP